MRRDDGSGGTPDGNTVPDAGTLVISTWHERGARGGGFRARITFGATSGAERTAVSTADAAQALRVVQEWLLAQAAVQDDD